MRSRSLRPILLACTALAAITSLAPAKAQTAATTTTNTNETQLQTIVVKGKRVPAGSVADTPLATETTAEEIRKKEIKDLSDLGNTTEAGIDFIKAKPGRTGGLFIRGLTGARVAVLVDEIPVPFLQTSARNGSMSPTTGINGQPDSFDVDSLGSLDVLRGADSSKVGSGALGGALAARTLEPEDLIGEGRDWGGVAKTGYDSEDKSFSNSVAIAKQVENTSVLFQGSYTRGQETDNQGTADIYGSSRTEPNPMDFVRNNLLFKFRHKLEGGHSIGLTAERYDYTSDTNLKTLQASTFTNATTTFRPDAYFGWDDVRRERVSVDYSYEAPSTDTIVQAASLRLYWQQLTKDAGSYGLRNSGTEYLRANEAQEDDFGVVGSLVSEFDTGTLDHQLRMRGNATIFETHQYISVFPVSSTVVSQSDAPDVDGMTLGFSVEDQITFGDSGFSLTPGIRFDFQDYDPQSSAGYTSNTGSNIFGLPGSFTDSNFSPKLLAEYQINESVGVFAQWAMAYRAPTVDELYGNFTNTTSNYASIGNANLQAETGHGFEVGAKWDTGAFKGGVTLFHNMYDNFINTVNRVGVSPQPTTIVTYENVRDARISGAEIKARKDFANGFFAEGSLAVAYGEYGNNGARIRSVAPLKAILGLGYEQETWGTQLTGIFSAAMPDDHVANTFDAPGYGVFNVSGWWEPEAVEGLRVQAGVYNIFDKTYWNAVGVESVNPNTASSANQPTAFYSEAGTTFKISLTQKF
jgi:hemoglobin/transferrin/lactoferrin receptor protein